MSARTGRVSRLPAADPALLNRLAWSTRWSDVQRSRDYAKQAYRDASEGEGRRSDKQRGFALRTLSWHARWQGDFEDALKTGLKAEECLPECDHPDARADLYANLAVVHFSRGRFDLANSSLERAMHLLSDTSQPESIVEVLCTRALVQTHSGDKTRAGLTLGRARENANESLIAIVEQMIGRWLLDDGELERAEKHIKKAIEAAKEHQNRVILPFCYEVRARCEIELKHYDKAAELVDKGMSISKELESMRSETHLTLVASIIEDRRGDPEAALDTLKRGARMAASAGYVLYQKRYALGLADIYERMGRYRKALEQHKAAWRFQNAIRS